MTEYLVAKEKPEMDARQTRRKGSEYNIPAYPSLILNTFTPHMYVII